MCRVGQNRIHTPYMTVYLMISLPKILYIHRIYMVLANPTYVCLCTWNSDLPEGSPTSMQPEGRQLLRDKHVLAYTNKHCVCLCTPGTAICQREAPHPCSPWAVGCLAACPAPLPAAGWQPCPVACVVYVYMCMCVCVCVCEGGGGGAFGCVFECEWEYIYTCMPVSMHVCMGLRERV